MQSSLRPVALRPLWAKGCGRAEGRSGPLGLASTTSELHGLGDHIFHDFAGAAADA
jgi:hypothetical protein